MPSSERVSRVLSKPEISITSSNTCLTSSNLLFISKGQSLVSFLHRHCPNKTRPSVVQLRFRDLKLGLVEFGWRVRVIHRGSRRRSLRNQIESREAILQESL